MSEEELPWWYKRCTHALHALDEWEVVREAEGVVVLYRKPLVHILVNFPDVGSSCSSVMLKQYGDWSEQQLLEHVQSRYRELKSLA